MNFLLQIIWSNRFFKYILFLNNFTKNNLVVSDFNGNPIRSNEMISLFNSMIKKICHLIQFILYDDNN